MHVAFWSPAWPLEGNHNGIITYVYAMKAGLEKRGHRVSVFTGRRDSGEAFEVKPSWGRRLKNKLSRKDFHAAFPAAISDAILREHRRNPIDVIEMEESFGWCADVAQATKLPLVVKLHGPAFMSFTEDHTPIIRERIAREGRALARCETIISPSRDTLERTLRHYQLKKNGARVVVNPIIIDEHAPRWDVKNCDRNTVLFVGRFDLRKGADVILKAMRSVWKIHPEAKLVFVGPEGILPSPQDGLQLGVWNYCASLFTPKERGRISFLGPRSPDEVRALRVSAAVTVVASRWESQGYTIIEAMGQGCPVVCSDAGACPEAVQHEQTGLLARSGDPEDFAAKISAMLSDQQSAAAMGKSARERVLDHYSIDRALDAMLECYRRASW